MENTGNRLEYLFGLYLSDQMDAEQYAELWKLMEDESGRDALPGQLQSLWERAAGERPLIGEKTWNENMQRRIRAAEATSGNVTTKPKIPLWKTHRWWAAAAAAAILLITSGLYLHQRQASPKDQVALHHQGQDDILPGGNKAVLTLSNGARIQLDSTAEGVIPRQGNARISKAGGGKIAYNVVNNNTADVVYNTLSTPRGGQYQLTLPDGSKVWLDAASSIRFPTSFSGDQRAVEITGEAYFEVAKNAAKPFVVSVDGLHVRVLGTHFNIMAYDDEPVIRTTLLEGSVSINKGGHSTLLRPGQQAWVDKTGKITLAGKVDVNETIAWKNHLFWFQDDDIGAVMRQVSRWYNVDVVIDGNIPQHFTGSLPRSASVSRVFEVLQETGRIHFEITGKKIVVTP